MSAATPKIALISAVMAAIAPAAGALEELYPEALVWNILDDRLLPDADSRGGVDEGLRARMDRLIGHALAEGADGILLTCSLYGPVARARRADVPVLAPDESAFAEIVSSDFGSVLVVASFDGARDDTVQRLSAALDAAGRTIAIEGLTVSAAKTASEAGDQDALAVALIDACALPSTNIDAVFLAQYSLAPAANELAAALGIPVLSGPASAASELRRRLRSQRSRS